MLYFLKINSVGGLVYFHCDLEGCGRLSWPYNEYTLLKVVQSRPDWPPNKMGIGLGLTLTLPLA